tara:strand:- start:30 stop:644 length:615 start_codon:yes stop_codon:yes gene_type:complete
MIRKLINKQTNKERHTMTQQQRYIPKDYILYSTATTVDLDFYWNNNDEKPSAVCFGKKGFKSKWHYRFKNFGQFESTLNDTIKNHLEHKKNVEERREKRFAPHSLKVNDILYCSWGYDQTNIDFYKITQLIGKNKIEVIKLKNKISYSSEASQSDYVLPTDEIKGSEKKYIVNSQYNSIRVYSFASASKWNGESLRQTDSLSGH